MSDIEFNVVCIECGDERGNAIIIDECHALTVKHCIEPNIIEKQEIILNFFSLDEDDFAQQNVELVGIASEQDGFALLKLSKPIKGSYKLELTNYYPNPFEEFVTFGFNKNYHEQPVWRKIKSCGSSTVLSKNLIYDMTFREDSKEKSMAGLSGSPIMCEDNKNKVIGLIVQQKNENGQAISINGISVLSQNNFLEQNKIEVHSLQNENALENGTIKSDVIHQQGYIAFGTSVDNDSVYDYKLNEIILLYRNGHIDKAFKMLNESIKEAEKGKVSDLIKGKYHLQLAIWLLEYKGKKVAANKQFEKAKKLAPDLDFRKFIALKSLCENKIDDALGGLHPVDSIEILNTYLQICINSNRSKKCEEVFDKYRNDYKSNENTYYLMSVAALMERNFELGQKYIEQAIEINDKSAKYYLQRALVTYWSAMPEYLIPENEIYPPIYSYIAAVLTEENLQLVIKAVKDFRHAYKIIDIESGDEYKEVILGIWLAALSVSVECRKMMSEPEELLKKVDRYNTVLLIVQMFNGNLSFDFNEIAKIKEKINSDNVQSLMLIWILSNHYKKMGDEITARSILFEYKEIYKKHQNIALWYEHVCDVSTNEEKKLFIEQIDEIPELSSIEKRRLKSLYLSDDYLIEKELEAIYDSTQKNSDLLNLLSFYKKSKKWGAIIHFSDILIEKYKNSCGYIYKIDALINDRQFLNALMLIEQIERKDILSFEKILKQYKISALDGLGRYQEALSETKELFKNNQTEQLAHKLSDYSLLVGDKIGAINFLSMVEESGKLSARGYQRLSDLYSTVDKERAVSYAKKAMEEDNSPQAKLWVYQHAATMGKSKEFEALIGDIFQNPRSIEGVQVLNIQEVFEMLDKSRNEILKREEAFLRAELMIHSVLDSNKGAYSSFFFSNWDSHNLTMMYGGHTIDNFECSSEIILDISSCILLYQLNLLSEVCENYSVYIHPDFMPLLIRDQSKLIPVQEDVFQKRKTVLEICTKDINITKVPQKLPENIEDIDRENRYEAIVAETALVHDAIWISLHENSDNSGITAEMFADQFMETDYGKKKVLVNILALEAWYEKDILFDIAEKYELLITIDEVEQIEREEQEREERRAQSKQTGEIIDILKNLIADNKIHFLANKEKSEICYTDMLIGEMKKVQSEQFTLCIDDRCAQSFGNGKEIPIISALDIIKKMYTDGILTRFKYFEVLRKIINTKILYFFPDQEYILYCLHTIDVDKITGKIKEPERLHSIRSYLNYAFLKLEANGKHELDHCIISERNSFFMQSGQIVRYLLEEIWKWDDCFEKKSAASNWVWMNVAMHGMRIDDQNTALKVNYVQLVMLGLIFAMSDKNNQEYNQWLNKIMNELVEYNPEYFEDVIEDVSNLFSSICFNFENVSLEDLEEYKSVIEKRGAFAIESMPILIQEQLLKHTELLRIFQKYYSQVIVLDKTIRIPESEWEKILEEISMQEQDIPIQKQLNGIDIQIKWKYEIPCLPCIGVAWEDKGEKKEVGVLTSIGERLRSKNIEVRLSEYKYIQDNFNYQENPMTKRMLMKEELYLTAADLLCEDILEDLKFQEEFIYNAISKNYLCRNDVNEFIVINNREFFLNQYDWKREHANFNKNCDCIPGIAFESEKKHNNPIQIVNSLIKKVMKGGDIDSLVDDLSLYLTNEKFFVYGQIYIGVLTVVFYAIDELFNDEFDQNKIIWTYIWTDKIMEALAKMVDMGLDIELWRNEFFEKNGMKEYINGDSGLFHEEYLDPRNMSLFKICFIWPCKVISDNWEEKYKTATRKILDLSNNLWNKYSEDLRSGRDMLVTSYNPRNTFKSILYTEDYQEVLFELNRKLSDTEEIEKYRELDKKEVSEIIKKEKLDKRECDLLRRLSVKRLDDEEIKLIEKCMQLFVMNQEAGIVKVEIYNLFFPFLPVITPTFLEEYQNCEYEKLKKVFLSEAEEYQQVMEKAIYLVKNEEYEPLINFLEELASSYKGKTSFEFIQFLFYIENRLPEKYQERIYLIRNLFGSK